MNIFIKFLLLILVLCNIAYPFTKDEKVQRKLDSLYVNKNYNEFISYGETILKADPHSFLSFNERYEESINYILDSTIITEYYKRQLNEKLDYFYQYKTITVSNNAKWVYKNAIVLEKLKSITQDSLKRMYEYVIKKDSLIVPDCYQRLSKATLSIEDNEINRMALTDLLIRTTKYRQNENQLFTTLNYVSTSLQNFIEILSKNFNSDLAKIWLIESYEKMADTISVNKILNSYSLDSTSNFDIALRYSLLLEKIKLHERAKQVLIRQIRFAKSNDILSVIYEKIFEIDVITKKYSSALFDLQKISKNLKTKGLACKLEADLYCQLYYNEKSKDIFTMSLLYLARNKYVEACKYDKNLAVDCQKIIYAISSKLPTINDYEKNGLKSGEEFNFEKSDKLNWIKIKFKI